MDLGSLSAAVSAADRGGYLIARKILDQAEQQGAQAVAMIRDAAAVSASAPRGAVSAVPGPTETGGRLDLRA
ncbi:MAG: hypothetical protein ACTS22_08080 [Phycisphaerales bacterium]